MNYAKLFLLVAAVIFLLLLIWHWGCVRFDAGWLARDRQAKRDAEEWEAKDAQEDAALKAEAATARAEASKLQRWVRKRGPKGRFVKGTDAIQGSE